VFLTSTNWPEQTFSTSFCGKGAEAGDKLNPGPPIGAKMWWAFGRFEVFVAAHGMMPTVPSMGTDVEVPMIQMRQCPVQVLTGEVPNDKDEVG